MLEGIDYLNDPLLSSPDEKPKVDRTPLLERAAEVLARIEAFVAETGAETSLGERAAPCWSACWPTNSLAYARLAPISLGLRPSTYAVSSSRGQQSPPRRWTIPY